MVYKSPFASKINISHIIFLKKLNSDFGIFLNSQSLVLYNLNVEVSNSLIYKPLKIERKINMTKPVENQAKYGLFKISGKNCLKIVFQTVFLKVSHEGREGTLGTNIKFE